MAKQHKYEFKPDRYAPAFLKRLVLTRLQRRRLLKWTLLTAACVLMLVLQDVLMSRIHFSGATTDLPVCIMLLIGLYEGTETGSLFVLIASIIYYFSGSAPNAYSIGLLTSLTIGINLLRQNLWRRSFLSMLLCGAMGIIAYEMGVFIIGLLSGLTILPRAGIFFLTGLFTCVCLLPVYPLVRAISKIGGDTWKE